MTEPESLLLPLERLRARQCAKWTVYDADVLPAWIADMDFALAPPVRAALAARLAAEDLGYPKMYPRAGLDALFAARMAAQYGWQIQRQQVEFFSDVVQIIHLALQTLLEPGDGVIIQTPIYPPFLQSVAETGRRQLLCPLAQTDAGYQIDFDALAAACADGARMLLLCHPHNPTGRAFTRDELEGLAALVRRYQLIVISDEIHADLMLVDRPHIPFATLGEDIAQRTLTLTSPSKAFNLAGLVLAVAVFGSPALRAQFGRLTEHVRGGRSAFGISATAAAWEAGEPWLAAVKARLRANRDTVSAFVRARWPAMRYTPPEATYLAWLDCRALELGEEPWRFFLREARVALSEGPSFGTEGEGFVRLNFATSPAILAEILARMDRALTTAGKSRPAAR